MKHWFQFDSSLADGILIRLQTWFCLVAVLRVVLPECQAPQSGSGNQVTSPWYTQFTNILMILALYCIIAELAGKTRSPGRYSQSWTLIFFKVALAWLAIGWNGKLERHCTPLCTIGVLQHIPELVISFMSLFIRPVCQYLYRTTARRFL